MQSEQAVLENPICLANCQVETKNSGVLLWLVMGLIVYVMFFKR